MARLIAAPSRLPHGLPVSSPPAAAGDARRWNGVRTVVQARALMQQGAPLALRIPGRAGWELRLVVQGGLRILDRIVALNYESWRVRPKLGLTDLPLLLWRAWRMKHQPDETSHSDTP